VHEPEDPHSPEDNAANVIEVSLAEEDNSQYERSRLRSLLPGAIYVLLGLAVLTALVLTLDSYLRNIFLGGLAALLAFVFIFGKLIVRSYNREKKNLMEQNPYRDDNIIR